MSKYNKFCRYCTGNKTKEIRECDDENCVFYPFKYGGLEKSIDVEIDKKLRSIK